MSGFVVASLGVRRLVRPCAVCQGVKNITTESTELGDLGVLCGTSDGLPSSV
jgi:hypothetical protein